MGCKTNHVNPETVACAEAPPVLYKMGKPVVEGLDCYTDSDCPRADGSIGKCACKSWWEGKGSPRYCELFVQDSSRPAFKQFWEVRLRHCHHDWSDERCAVETGLVDVLSQINSEGEVRRSDPTEVQQCARDMLSTDFNQMSGASSTHSWRCISVASISLCAALIGK